MGRMAAVAMRARARAEPDLGVVDYTLAKRALLRQVRRGTMSPLDVCDAHPELMRAARSVGREIARQCPVCDRQPLRLLAYVYADDLKRDNGRVWELDRAISLAAQRRGGACYVVEVCTGCAWNHLTEAFVRRTAG
jgi:Family of unknown function (DUF5318)